MAVLLSDLVDRADIGMVQGRSRLSLSLKAGQGLWISGYFIGKKLQGNKPVQRYVLSLVDHTHPATAEFLDNAVVRDGLTNHDFTIVA